MAIIRGSVNRMKAGAPPMKLAKKIGTRPPMPGDGEKAAAVKKAPKKGGKR